MPTKTYTQSARVDSLEEPTLVNFLRVWQGQTLTKTNALLFFKDKELLSKKDQDQVSLIFDEDALKIKSGLAIRCQIRECSSLAQGSDRFCTPCRMGL